MIIDLFLAAITAVILLGKGSAQNPNGDSLLCYDNTITGKPTPPICLAAALSDGAVDIKGRIHKAGEVFGGACSKTPQVTWVVKNESGITSLRLQSDQTKCLTYKSSDPVAQLTPCQSGNRYQHNEFDNHPYSTPYWTWSFYNGPAGLYLSYDQARHRIKKAGVDTEWECNAWVWLSDVEKQAAAVRNKPFSFPVKGLTNPLRAQYAAAFVDQMVNNTRYPREIYKQDSLYNGCTGGPASCFPIDYDVGQGLPSGLLTSYIELDLTLEYGGVGYENTPSKNLYPTGTFAIPGQDFTIELDNFNTSRVAIMAHLYMQDIPFGYASNIIRPGHVALHDGLLPGVNTIRNIYGGPLSLEVIGTDLDNPSVITKITNTIPMATFVLYVTTESEWRRELENQPNWVIFQGEHQIGLDIKAPYTNLSFAQMETMVKRYDILMKNNFLLSGYDLDAEDGTIHAFPKGWMWWARDSTFDSMYAKNPLELAWFNNNKDKLLDWTKVSSWGIPHEFGHTFQTRCFSNLYGTEVTNNLYTVFQDSYFCNNGKFTGMCDNVPTGHDFVGFLPTVKSHLASGVTYANMSKGEPEYNNLFDALYFWLQLVAHYGYVPHRNMQRRFRERMVDPTDTLCDGNDQGKYDAVYETWSEMAGEDLTKHFVTYGVPISQAAKDRVAAKHYPQPSVDISSIEIVQGMPMTWNPTGNQPSFALPPYSG